MLTRVLCVSVCCLALAGCTTVSVSADWDPDADFAALKTWSWQKDAVPGTGDPRLDDPLVHARIQKAIETALPAKGYTQMTSGPSDFTVSYHIAIQRKLDAHTIYRGYGPYSGWYGTSSTQTIVDDYELGTLLVDFISPKTNTVIWRGKAQSRLYEIKSPQKRQARVQAAVDELLAQFPPK